MKKLSITDFINSIPAERQGILTAIHEAILANDPSVVPVIKPMMGKEMILYEERCYMKYGLASTKNYMSLHCMPMYINPALHAKYVGLLPAAKFQKGCINFMNGEELPITFLVELIIDCSAINIIVRPLTLRPCWKTGRKSRNEPVSFVCIPAKIQSGLMFSNCAVRSL